MVEPEITEEIISQISGKELFNTLIRLKHSSMGDRHPLLKVCYKRAVELNKNRFGDWEHAKVEVNHMPPQYYFESRELLPVMGYPCHFMFSKSGSYLVLFNSKLNEAYMVGTGEVTTSQAKSIFNS